MRMGISGGPWRDGGAVFLVRGLREASEFIVKEKLTLTLGW